ncbi:MAG: prepilin-type N-terminal cleavage/methylation domain-containing protein [Patescibacteria group bacterium]|nr:prepilin-type N-terminal cleavage/methylation domain-containing protein [Patescibacteria group bacterium]
MKANKQGFTLIELIIVIVIIGILAAIVAGLALTNSRERANDVKRKKIAGDIAKAAETYYADNGAYPVDVAAMTGGGYLSANALSDAEDAAAIAYNPDGTAVGCFSVEVTLENDKDPDSPTYSVPCTQ